MGAFRSLYLGIAESTLTVLLGSGILIAIIVIINPKALDKPSNFKLPPKPVSTLEEKRLKCVERNVRLHLAYKVEITEELLIMFCGKPVN